MWLLSTDLSELHFFSSPQDVTGGYAILSHTWGKHEQTFQDLQAIRKQCEIDGKSPRDFVCPKIRHCCMVAESQGYKWVWIDASCIDKTSSTELSEAINSMFGWYARSEVCYAYLADVPSGTDLHAPNSAFRRSRWHTRGWTLQELIAPSVVVFLSREWQPLGTRAGLASLLRKITRIPERYLTHVQHHSVASVVERMTWAAKRRTTRIEDGAYCLMGIFNVNIPIIYGEGVNAFKRLQLEIMRTSMDTTLFAWGAMFPRHRLFNPAPNDELAVASHTPSSSIYLLAPSPRHFSSRIGTETRFTPVSLGPRQPYVPWQWATLEAEDVAGKYSDEQQRRGPFGTVELPRFELTSYGVKCHVPIIEIPNGPTIAVLLCESTREHIGLLLHPSHTHIWQDPSQERYHTGYATVSSNPNAIDIFRLISLGGDLYDLRYNGVPVRAQWRDIHIVDGPPAHEERLYGPDVSFINCPAHTPFRIPHWLLSRLHAMDLVLTHSNVNDVDGAWFIFQDITTNDQGFILYLGAHCTRRPGESCHWAKAFPLGDEYSHHWLERGMSHDCATDHVADWPGWSKLVGDAAKMLRMSFTRCRLEPETTLVLHLELGGEVWTELMDDARISFPTREELGLSNPCILSESIAVAT